MEEKTDYKFRDITIPGDILEDSNLSDGAKIMYGKIARLSWKTGVCWASNAFLDGTMSGRNASRFIAELKKAQYITIENEKSRHRKIKICSILSKIHLANSSDVNSTSPNMAESKILPRQNRRSYLANSGEVHLANSGDRTPQDPTNLNNTTTAASGKPEPNEEPPPAANAAAAALSPGELKNLFLSIDNRLIFNSGFYQKALNLMADKGLSNKYISWLRDQCENKDYRDFKSFYYALFFEDSIAEEFLILSAAEKEKADKPALARICPACNTTLGIIDKECPECKLTADFPSPDQINFHRELFKLIPEKRNEYLLQENKIYSECSKDFVKLKQNIKKLKNEYGLVSV